MPFVAYKHQLMYIVYMYIVVAFKVEIVKLGWVVIGQGLKQQMLVQVKYVWQEKINQSAALVAVNWDKNVWMP